MILKELGILNFGKFKNKKIELKEGINLITGKNESGKSTVHSFIEACFYGFAKNTKSRRKSEEHDLLKPWGREKYSGYIDFFDDFNYRLFRDFNSDDVQVLNTDLDEKVDREEFYEHSKIAQPGVYFFCMDSNSFKSSFFISQMETRIGKKESESLINRLNNLIQTKDEDVSAQNAIDQIKRDIKNIGSKGKKKSLIGFKAEELEKLELKIELLKKNRPDIQSKKIEVLNLIKEIKDIDKKISRRARYDYQILLKEFKEIEEKIDIAEAVDEEDFQNALLLNDRLAILNMEIDELKDETRKDLKSKFELIQEDYREYKKVISKINELNSNNYSKEIQSLRFEISNIKTLKITFLLRILASIFVILGILFIAIKREIYPLLILSLIPGLYAYLRFAKYRINSELLDRLSERLEELSFKSMQKTQEKKNFDKYFEGLKLKYSTDDLEEFFQINWESLNEERIREGFKRQKEIEISQKQKNVEKINGELKTLLNKYGVLSISELKELYANRACEDLSFRKLEIKDELNRLKKLFGDETLDYRENTIDELKLLRENLDNRLKKTSAAIEMLEAEEDNLQELLEERLYRIQEIKDLEFERDAHELALKTLEDILEDNRHFYLPLLKSQTEELLEAITNGKYKRVFIDEEYNIKIYDSAEERFVEARSLSAGTVDELYFAFRIAIAKLLSDKFILILDDQFANYDDDRLKRTICYLKKFPQILLFCTGYREKEIMDGLNIKYNWIEL